MEFKITHNNKTSSFDTADEMYIFGLGIEYEVEKKHGVNIEEFVACIYKCHAYNCFNTPLKHFTKYMADWWEVTQKDDPRAVIESYYRLQDI